MQFYSVVSQKVEALKMEPKILDRNVNEGFSGGERKRNEILQLSVRLLWAIRHPNLAVTSLMCYHCITY